MFLHLTFLILLAGAAAWLFCLGLLVRHEE
jgi:hypothetical protein